MDAAPRRTGPDWGALLSPPFLLALGTLLLNDHVLKPAFHNALTGKLSDVAGLYAFAAFWGAIWPSRRPAVAALTGALFVCWKLPLSQPFLDAWNAVAPWEIARVVDVTDLAALPVLIPAARMGPPRIGLATARRRAAAAAAGVLSVLAFAATGCPDCPDNSVALHNWRYSFAEPPEAVAARLVALGFAAPGREPSTWDADATLYFDVDLLDLDGAGVFLTLRAKGDSSLVQAWRAVPGWDGKPVQKRNVRREVERCVIKPLRLPPAPPPEAEPCARGRGFPPPETSSP